MIRRGEATIYQACARYQSRHSSQYNNWRCKFAESTVWRVANRVMLGERIEDAWRNELQQIRQKKNPR